MDPLMFLDAVWEGLYRYRKDFTLQTFVKEASMKSCMGPKVGISEVFRKYLPPRSPDVVTVRGSDSGREMKYVELPPYGAKYYRMDSHVVFILEKGGEERVFVYLDKRFIYPEVVDTTDAQHSRGAKRLLAGIAASDLCQVEVGDIVTPDMIMSAIHGLGGPERTVFHEEFFDHTSAISDDWFLRYWRSRVYSIIEVIGIGGRNSSGIAPYRLIRTNSENIVFSIG